MMHVCKYLKMILYIQVCVTRKHYGMFIRNILPSDSKTKISGLHVLSLELFYSFIQLQTISHLFWLLHFPVWMLFFLHGKSIIFCYPGKVTEVRGFSAFACLPSVYDASAQMQHMPANCFRTTTGMYLALKESYV